MRCLYFVLISILTLACSSDNQINSETNADSVKTVEPYIIKTNQSMQSIENQTQEIDTTQILNEIKSMFDEIYSKNIVDLKICYFDEYKKVDSLAEGEEVFGGESRYTIYYKDSSIYMIRHFMLSDEGGPSSFTCSLKEIYLRDNIPFFNYTKKFGFEEFNDEGIPFYQLRETREYIHDRSVFLKLEKKTIKQGFWLNTEDDLINVATDSVQNTNVEIEPNKRKIDYRSSDFNQYFEIIRLNEMKN